MVRSLPRTFCQWKSPPTLICSTWISFERKISVDPPSVSSLGWLKLLTKSVSNRISGVKNFESHTASLLWGLPFSQDQSAKAKGTDGGCFSGVAAGVATDSVCGSAGEGGPRAGASSLAFATGPAAAVDGGSGAALAF